jgi:hypothetical protein
VIDPTVYIKYKRAFFIATNLFCAFCSRVKFGRWMFFMNLLMYLGYLGCLTTYVYMEYPDLLDEPNGCPIILSKEEWENDTLKAEFRKVNNLCS